MSYEDMLWPVFLAVSAVIVYGGSNLSRYGDVIAEKTGMGRAWVGLILLATVTSLPELVTGISSVALASAPDIAAGDVFGSCVFNLVIIALMNLAFMKKDQYQRIERADTHVLMAVASIALIGIASFSVLASGVIPAIAHVGLYAPVIILVYLASVRAIYSFEKQDVKGAVEARSHSDISLKTAYARFVFNSALVVAAAIFLPFIAKKIAESSGLGQSFVGSYLVALTTSLPELVVSMAAMRAGAIDLALANIFGSNMFNVVIIAIDDVFYVKGPVLADVTSSHAITGIMAMIMSAVAVMAIVNRGRAARFKWENFALIFLWVVNAITLWTLR